MPPSSLRAQRSRPRGARTSRRAGEASRRLNYSKERRPASESSEASTRAGQLTQIDIATFIQWVNASVAGKPKLAQFYRQRFREEFRPAFAAWLATNPRTNPKAPLTPFAMPQYRVAEAVKSSSLNASAGVHANAADKANKRANDYVLAVVLFAACLFFAGISTKIHAAAGSARRCSGSAG